MSDKQPGKKPTGELLAEIQALQEARNQLRAQMQDTMDKLADNAEQLNDAIIRADDAHGKP